jgi:hypothetical protein
MRVSLLDTAVLVHGVVKGAGTAEVGYEDANTKLADMRAELNKVIWLDDEDVESALYSCRLLAEHGEWSHPDGLSFEAFAAKLAGKGRRYSLTHSVFEQTD